MLPCAPKGPSSFFCFWTVSSLKWPVCDTDFDHGEGETAWTALVLKRPFQPLLKLSICCPCCCFTRSWCCVLGNLHRTFDCAVVDGGIFIWRGLGRWRNQVTWVLKNIVPLQSSLPFPLTLRNNFTDHMSRNIIGYLTLQMCWSSEGERSPTRP